MKAIILEKHGDYNNLKFVDDYPNPFFDITDNKSKHNEVIVKIIYTTVNRIDLTLRKGYQTNNQTESRNQTSPFVFPHILGSDVIGEIVEIKDNNEDFRVGDKIIALPKFSIGDKYYTIGLNCEGSYCEYIKLPITSLVKLPSIENNDENNIDNNNENNDKDELEKYSGLPTAGLIAYNLLSEYKSEKNENKNLLIIGGGGGVGTFVIQLAKYFGFNVITTAGNQKNINSLYELKADEVFNHYDLDYKELISQKYNNNIDLIIDYLGGDNFGFYVDLIKNNGKIKTIGAMGNRFTNIDLQKIYSKNITIQGASFGTKKQLQKLVKLTNENKIKTIVNNRFILEEIPEIHKLMETKSYFGENIIKV